MGNARKVEEWVRERLFGRWKNGFMSNCLVVREQLFGPGLRHQEPLTEWRMHYPLNLSKVLNISLEVTIDIERPDYVGRAGSTKQRKIFPDLTLIRNHSKKSVKERWDALSDFIAVLPFFYPFQDGFR